MNVKTGPITTIGSAAAAVVSNLESKMEQAKTQLTVGEERISRIPAKHAQTPAPVVANEASAMLAVIERAASNPSVDIDKMERLMQMHDRMRERQAREAFALAFADMVLDLPSISRTGGITVYSKSDREYAAKNQGEYPAGAKPIQQTPYATIDAILEGVNPVLSAHGFSVRFEHETVPTGESYRIKTICILTHKDGHSERAETPPLMQDSSGSKNNVQSVGSSMKYGRRYALMAVLPIVSHAPQDNDDDGKAAGASGLVTDDQVAQIEAQIGNGGGEKTLAYFKIEKWSDLPANQFDRVMAAIAKKKKDAANG